jgi:hypothetical protein
MSSKPVYDPKVYDPKIGRPLSFFFKSRYTKKLMEPPKHFRFVLKPGALKDKYGNPFVNRVGHGNVPEDSLFVEDSESEKDIVYTPGV